MIPLVSHSHNLKASSSKGIFSSIKRKYKGKVKSHPANNINAPLIMFGTGQDSQVRRQTPNQMRNCKAGWTRFVRDSVMSFQPIYHVEATRMFLIDLNLGEEAPSFKAYSDEVTCVGELIKQFNKDMNERPGDYLSDEMKELIKEVMNQMSSVLQGSNNEELSKIAACAKALADITAAKRPASYQMTTLEKTNLGYIKALWDTYIRSSDDGKVNHLLDTLRNLWTAKV
ncbi:hypothetical protein Pst134EB_008418 [Puccinia striiformis f. sp. tritici]|nr:hypothetical protein Pst134EB_008418 [Puccinia striiformis f. sp. tritici]